MSSAALPTQAPVGESQFCGSRPRRGKLRLCPRISWVGFSSTNARSFHDSSGRWARSAQIWPNWWPLLATTRCSWRKPTAKAEFTGGFGTFPNLQVRLGTSDSRIWWQKLHNSGFICHHMSKNWSYFINYSVGDFKLNLAPKILAGLRAWLQLHCRYELLGWTAPVRERWLVNVSH